MRDEAERLRQKRNRAMFEVIHEGLRSCVLAPRPDHVNTLTTLLTQLDEMCEGFLERRWDTAANSEVLDFWISDARVTEVHRVSKLLADFLMFEEVPESKGTGQYPAAFRLFGGLGSGRPSSDMRGYRHYRIKLSGRLMPAMCPGIRGWDLPCAQAHRQFSPQLSKRYATLLEADRSGSEARMLWQAASTALPRSLRSLLAENGLSVGFEPPALRYLTESPLAADNRAPLLLMRLLDSMGKAAGVQSINLNSGERKSRFFGRAIDEAYGAIWLAREATLVATTLEDAIALHDRLAHPVIITPTPAALAALPIIALVKRLEVFLPAAANAEWHIAAQALLQHQREHGVRGVCRVPTVPPNATHTGLLSWHEHFKTKGELGRS